MKRFFQFSLILFTIWNSNSQPGDQVDYELLNAVIHDITFTKPEDTIRFYETPIEFREQEHFFTKESFTEYTFPVVGVDSKKVKRLLRKLDFKYLASQIPNNNEKWVKDKFKANVLLYSNDPKNALNKQTQFKISKPVYSKCNKYAFIYYYKGCGFYDCGSTTVRTYKKVKGKWKFYVLFPVSLS